MHMQDISPVNDALRWMSVIVRGSYSDVRFGTTVHSSGIHDQRYNNIMS